MQIVVIEPVGRMFTKLDKKKVGRSLPFALYNLLEETTPEKLLFWVDIFFDKLKLIFKYRFYSYMLF